MIFDKPLLRRIRNEFPRAVSDATGRKRAFMDNGTGSLVVGRAAKAEARARIDFSANVHGIFTESQDADATILKGRKAVAELLNASSENEIVSGESTTSLLFNLSHAIGKKLTAQDNIVVTDYEHYANVSPWVELQKRGAVREVRFARLNPDRGTLDLDHLESLVDGNTKVVAVTAASNALGTKTPLEEVGRITKSAGAYFVVDAVHHASHGPIDVQTIDCDFLVFSGYKMFSSHGSFLYGKERHLEALEPYKVAPAPNHGPEKWEWGTRDQTGFAAMTGVTDHLVWLAGQVSGWYRTQLKQYDGRRRSLKIAMHAIEAYGRDLSRMVLEGNGRVVGLLQMPRVKIYGLKDPNRLSERDPTFSFKIEDVPDQEVAQRLWKEYAIASRAEDFYSRALGVYGVTSAVRVSLVHYSTPDEVRKLLTGIKSISQS